MKIATWNVNSIRARLPRVVAWLTEHKPDVICMQETKVTDDDFPEIDVRALGYVTTLFGQKTYNGVAILSRERPSDVERGFQDGHDDSQARFLAATVGGLRFLTAYVPNGQSVGSDKFSYKLEWLRRLRAYLDAKCRADASLVLCGDFNIAPEPRDVHDPAVWEGQVMCHPDERAALERVRAWGFVDLFRKHHLEPGFFTWWDYRQLAFPKNVGLRIDHLWGTPPVVERCSECFIDRNARKGKQPSDHAPVLAVIADA
jgi:exodeoxyribonuclease III